MRSRVKSLSAQSSERERRQASLKAIVAMFLCASALLGIGASAASAAPSAHPGWGLQNSVPLDQEGTYETPRNPLAFGPDGLIAVNQHTTGVRLFEPVEPAGLEEVPGSVAAFFSTLLPRNVAVDPTTGTAYLDEIAAFGGSTVRRYTPTGSTPPGYSVDPGFEVPQGDAIAVDPSTHDLLVADSGAEDIRRYDTTGKLLETISTAGINPSWLLPMADGSFYVASASGPDLYHLSGPGTQLGTIAGVGSIHGLGYDAVRDLIVVAVGAELVGYSPLGTRIAESPTPSGQGVGIALSPNGTLYENSGQPADINIYLPGTVPGVEAVNALEVTATTAKLEVEVDPGDEGGSPPAGSAVRFEYRLVGATEWTAAPDQPVDAAGAYGGELTGLNSNAEYEVRAVASNSVINSPSAPVTFTTPPGAPKITIYPVTQLGESSAVIEGKINPFGLSTTYYIEYGTSVAYGSRIPVEGEALAGQGVVDKSISKTIFGLSPGTTYHFRLVATNAAGTAKGSDHTFTTAAAGSIPVRAYEQVTPADKHGGAVIGGLAVLAEANGNGITYITKAGSQSSPIAARSLARRASSDWSGKIDTDPPLAVGNNAFQTHTTLAVSEDFEHTFVVSNRALTPGGIEQGANLYKVDLATGAYHLVAATDAEGAFNLFAGSTTSGTFQAGAPDLNWIVFISPPPLVPGAPVGAIYRWSEAEGLEVVSTLPDGDMTASMKVPESVYRSVSADGSKIYYSAFGGSEEGVFLREDGGEPRAISVSQVPGDPATPQPAILLGINEDGHYAFLASTEKLTSDAPGEVPGGEVQGLYRYDASDGSLEYLKVQATVNLSKLGQLYLFSNGSYGISEDGSTIYFNTTEGERHPFRVWRDGEIDEAFPTKIERGDEHVSPNGRYFAAYQTVNGVQHVVELYDAETKQASCVTCLADGTPVAGRLSPPATGDILLNNQSPRVVGNDGAVYFDTEARLVAADANGASDVYSYRGGTRRLISPGNRPFDAVLADASANGSDVFFTTAQKLVGRDNDESVDIYDARVNGGLPAQSPPPPQECLRDDCKATPAAGPELPFGGSEALSGPGNVTPAKKRVTCGKAKRKVKHQGKVKCVKKHKASKNRKGGNR